RTALGAMAEVARKPSSRTTSETFEPGLNKRMRTPEDGSRSIKRAGNGLRWGTLRIVRGRSSDVNSRGGIAAHGTAGPTVLRRPFLTAETQSRGGDAERLSAFRAPASRMVPL